MTAARIRAHLLASAMIWPEPKPLPTQLLVAPFDAALLPAPFRPWVMDISDRMQCPADYVAVAAIVAAGSVVGRRVGIRPQAKTDWVEVANLWGCGIGRPGVLKSPAMAHAQKPLHRLDAKAADANHLKIAQHALALESHKAAQAAARAHIKKGGLIAASILGEPEPPAPAMKRYVVNDATYEALGVVMADNPNGVLVFRDELISMLKPLDRAENAAARGFFLSAWNGTQGYTFDRIMRGRTHIDACCMSLLGATQPAKIASYLGDAVRGGAGDDGFAQRLGLLVWPDVAADWEDVDREPDAEGRRRADFVFDRLDALDPQLIGAHRDEYDPVPYLRFAPDALAEFTAWRVGFEPRIRGGELHDAMASHLNKYRGLVPKLALLFHLIEGGEGPVGVGPLVMALAWIEYLETHAARAYASVTISKTAGARSILAKLKAGALASPFTARDVYDKNWSGLTDPDTVRQSLGLLADYDWVAEETIVTGGRPKTLTPSIRGGSPSELPRAPQGDKFERGPHSGTRKSLKSPF